MEGIYSWKGYAHGRDMLMLTLQPTNQPTNQQNLLLSTDMRVRVQLQAAKGGGASPTPQLKTARELAREKEEADRLVAERKAAERKAAEEAVKRYYASSAAKSVHAPSHTEPSSANASEGYDMTDPTFAAFRLFDPEASGFVNQADLRDVLRSAGIKTKSVEFKSLKERLAKMRDAHPAAYVNAGNAGKPDATLVSFDHLLVALREGGFVESYTTAHKSAGTDPLAPQKIVVAKAYEATEQEVDAFKMFDSENSGKVQVRELRIILRSCGHELTTDEIESMALRLCSTREIVTFEEFKNLLGGIHKGEAVSLCVYSTNGFASLDVHFLCTSTPCIVFDYPLDTSSTCSQRTHQPIQPNLANQIRCTTAKGIIFGLHIFRRHIFGRHIFLVTYLVFTYLVVTYFSFHLSRLLFCCFDAHRMCCRKRSAPSSITPTSSAGW
jgi:Ca2+-binding EF-hand superfamily protein